jgi:hypothetical protein
LQLCLNVAGGHATGIQGQDFVIEAFQARLAFFDELRLERALPITRDVDFNVPLLSLHGLLAPTIAQVPVGVALASMFGVAQVRVQFGFQAAFDHCLGQFFEQAAFSQDVLGCLVLFEQFINEFASNSHPLLLAT